MEKYQIQTYDDIIRVSVGKFKEALVDVCTYDESILSEYENNDMLPYAGQIILVRRTLAKKLARINKYLKEEYRLKLKVVYGYRHPEIQMRYFQDNRSVLAKKFNNLNDTELNALTHNLIAIPEIAGHPVGGAVDLTLVDINDVECDMGTRIADFSDSDRIRTFCRNITDDQLMNRRILLEAMTNENFAPFYGEWWHFSYGDREWAAFYGKASAIYGTVDLAPIEKPDTISLITSAGGNGTAIQLIDRPWERYEYEAAGKALVSSLEVYGAEQAGFLIADISHFEMAGGEFCGNATCAAALILSKLSNQPIVNFSVSGMNVTVSSQINELSIGAYRVISKFANIDYMLSKGCLSDGGLVDIVDFGGIVHIIIRAAFPASADERRRVHESVIKEFGFAAKDAVGVIWFNQIEKIVAINPVVWVKSVNSFCYESSCGSGSIAVALITNRRVIRQPTGETIKVGVDNNQISLETMMKFVEYAKK